MSFAPSTPSLSINWSEAAKRLANVQLEEWANQNASIIAADPSWLDAKFSEFALEWKRLMMEAVLAGTLSCHNLYRKNTSTLKDTSKLKDTATLEDTRVFSIDTLHSYVDTSADIFGFYAGDFDMDLLTSEVSDWLQSVLPRAEWHKIPAALNKACPDSPASPHFAPRHNDEAVLAIGALSATERKSDCAEDDELSPPENGKDLKARQALGLIVKMLMASAPGKYRWGDKPNRQAIAASMLDHVDESLWEAKPSKTGEGEEETVRGFSESTIMRLLASSYKEWCKLEESRKRGEKTSSKQ